MENEYLVNSDDLTAVAAAIREKGGTEEPLIFPDGFISAVQGIQSGGGTIPAASSKDVNFYDYDGTLLYSYTLEEAQSLTALPDGPIHDGLVFDGWNYSLESVKSLTKAMNIGALYSTDDGTTRIYIHLEDGRTSPMLGICPNGTVTVDWGDGTDADVLTGTDLETVKWTPTHHYASPGDYVIRLTVDGEARLYGSDSSDTYSHILRHSADSSRLNSLYQNAIRRVEIGSGILIGQYAFNGCSSLSSITIPDGVKSIEQSAFQSCSALSSITIPDGVTSIERGAFYSCRSLSSIAIPDGVTTIERGAFFGCYSLSSITIPDGVTTIEQDAFSGCSALSSIAIPDGVTSIGQMAFDSCSALSSITIPDGVKSIEQSAFQSCSSLSSITIPNGVTSIGQMAFYGCSSLSSITIPDGVTSIGQYAFSGCRFLSSITIPDGVTSIEPYAFQSCSSLSSITIPDGVTSIGQFAFSGCSALSSITIPDGVTSIGQFAFDNCRFLSSITIPDGVTSIEGYTFYSCYGMRYYDFTSFQAIPTLYDTYAFYGISADCEIRVPSALVDEWKAATNWGTYADYIVGV